MEEKPYFLIRASLKHSHMTTVFVHSVVNNCRFAHLQRSAAGDEKNHRPQTDHDSVEPLNETVYQVILHICRQ